MKIFRQSGVPDHPAWATWVFGDIRVGPRPDLNSPGFEVIELRESYSDILQVTVLDEDRGEIDNLAVACWWPAPFLPELPDIFQRTDRGVHTFTEGGVVSFAMGRGDAYTPKEGQAATTVWCQGNSGLVSGIGWLAGSHYRHLDVVFQLTKPSDAAGNVMVHLEAALDSLVAARDIVREVAK